MRAAAPASQRSDRLGGLLGCLLFALPGALVALVMAFLAGWILGEGGDGLMQEGSSAAPENGMLIAQLGILGSWTLQSLVQLPGSCRKELEEGDTILLELDDDEQEQDSVLGPKQKRRPPLPLE